MGVDVSFLIQPHEPFDDEQLAAASAALRDQFPDEYCRSEGDPHWPDLKPFSRFGPPHELLEVVSMQRFFAPWAHRGGWPWIRALGDWLIVFFGETAELRYGSDHSCEWDLMRPWPEIRPLCEEAWQELVRTDPKRREADEVWRSQQLERR